MATLFSNKQNEENQAKRAVATWIWENVISTDRNPRLIIDAGSSAQCVAEVIAERVGEMDEESIASEQDFSWMTVLTHNFGAWEALQGLRTGLDLFLVGGRHDRRINANVEPATIGSTLSDFNPSIVIVAASGLDPEGLYCSAVQDERPVKEAIARRKTTMRIVLADHTKIGRTDVRRFASLDDLKADTRQIRIITNDVDVSTLPQDQAAEYQATLAAFRKTLGKDGVVLVPTKTRAESRSSGGRGKKAAVAADRASGPGLAAVDSGPAEKREAV